MIRENDNATSCSLVAPGASAIHGTGLFATIQIAPGTKVIEYVGERISKAESLQRCERGNHCIFWLSETEDLNGDFEWNLARFINHSCSPNCEADLIDGHIWITAIRSISAGEEITFDYGYDLDSYREHPCACGSESCVGYIVGAEFFSYLRGMQGLAVQV